MAAATRQSARRLWREYPNLARRCCVYPGELAVYACTTRFGKLWSTWHSCICDVCTSGVKAVTGFSGFCGSRAASAVKSRAPVGENDVNLAWPDPGGRHLHRQLHRQVKELENVAFGKPVRISYSKYQRQRNVNGSLTPKYWKSL